MVVLKPLKVHLEGLPTEVSQRTFHVPDFPMDSSRGSHPIVMEDIIYIDQSDFRSVDDDNYYGLAPSKLVGLKYGFRIRCNRVEYNPNDSKEPIALFCHVLKPDEDLNEKHKGTIQWVSAISAIPCEVRLYHHLFITEEPNDANWEKELNPESEVIMSQALIDPSLINYYHSQLVSNTISHFQFERIGFFVLDKDTNLQNNHFVFNLTISLKDSKPIDPNANTNTSTANKSRKEEQMKLLAEKQVSHPFIITNLVSY